MAVDSPKISRNASDECSLQNLSVAFVLVPTRDGRRIAIYGMRILWATLGYFILREMGYLNLKVMATRHFLCEVVSTLFLASALIEAPDVGAEAL